MNRKHTLGKQITVGQLIEKRIVMTIFKEMIMYIDIMSETSRPTPAYIYYYYSTNRPLSSMHLVKEICPRGNNKVVILYFLIYDKGLLFMLELY